MSDLKSQLKEANILIRSLSDALQILFQDGGQDYAKASRIYTDCLIAVREHLALEKDSKVTAKTYYTMDNVGKTKYTASAHDGIQTHKDGSPFYGIRIFTNKKKMKAYVSGLIKDGYKLRGIK